jgi:hypothetical protein
VFSLASPPLTETFKIEQALAKGQLSRPTNIQITGSLGSNPSFATALSLELVPIPAQRRLVRRIGGYLDFTYEGRNFTMLVPNKFQHLNELNGQTLTLTLPTDKLEFFKATWQYSASLYIKDKSYYGQMDFSTGTIKFHFD